MKRFHFLFLVVLVLLLGGFSSKAEAFPNPPFNVPYTYNGTTYDQILQFANPDNTATIFYYRSSLTPPQIYFQNSGVILNISLNQSCLNYYASDGSNFSYNGTYSGVAQLSPYQGWTSLASVRATADIAFNGALGGNGSPYNVGNHWGLQSVSTGDVLINASAFGGGGPVRQLAINLDSSTGSVSSSETTPFIHCNDQAGSVCSYGYPVQTSVTLTATPKTDYAFAYWDDGTNQIAENPHTLTMDSAKTLTAKFFKTFRCAVGNFRYNIGDNGGECVEYVRDETDITLSGNACIWYNSAISAGYYVTPDPENSSIIIFNNQSSMPNGHVAIVKQKVDATHLLLRDSNWCDPATCHEIKEHEVDISQYDVLGYIHCTPQN